MSDKIAYNKGQAETYGWTPEWFSATAFDQQLVDNIAAFQRANGLTADGMCGPSTYRVKYNEIESDGNFVLSHSIENGDKYIVHAGNAVEIFWDKVVLWTQNPKFAAKSYTDMGGKPERKINMFVNHWDVCLSSSSCQNVLNNRGLSVQFLLDNDGTIIQTTDTQNICYHAGRTVNNVSVGIEISDAYYLKYQDWYIKNGFGPRPIWENAQVNGSTLEPFLGFYDVQIEALAALWEAISYACDIPLKIVDNNHCYDRDVANGTFQGFVNHYNITTKKIDCAGLDNAAVLAKALELRKKR
jgi:hypothetical protein